MEDSKELNVSVEELKERNLPENRLYERYWTAKCHIAMNVDAGCCWQTTKRVANATFSMER